MDFSMGNIIIIYFLESGLYDYCGIIYDDDCCYYFSRFINVFYSLQLVCLLMRCAVAFNIALFAKRGILSIMLSI